MIFDDVVNSSKKNIKFKFLNFNALVINLDRLSRFKNPNESYDRVFTDILTKYLIYPKLSSEQIKNMDGKTISKYVSLIWNSSIVEIFKTKKNNQNVNIALRLLSTIPFKNIETRTKIMLRTRLILSPLLDNIPIESSSLNLQLLIKVNKTFNNNIKLNKAGLIKFSNEHNLRYPITKLIIVEGITEEILLPIFASKLNYNFDSNGTFILGAGGKSKSPTLYMNLKKFLSIPVILLFDKDAHSICKTLSKSLLKKDKIILLENGEFEDILSLNLIKRSLNKEYDIVSQAKIVDLTIFDNMVENLENFYKTRKIGEFKKAKFAKLLANNIKYDTDITNDIKKLVAELY